MKPRHAEPAILLISGIGIAYQVGLIRVFSITQWHHFAYMIISVAMLGFGASGTALALLRARLRGREAGALRLTAFALAVSLPAAYLLAQRIPFDTFRLMAERAQFLYLLLLYLVLSTPFFLVAACLALAFMANPARVARLYCVNMLGSGLGAAAAPLLLFVLHPVSLLFYLLLPAFAAAALLALDAQRGRGVLRTAAVALALTALLLFLPRAWFPPRISEYKNLSYALQAPDAEIVAQTCSPFAVVTAVQSAQIRETPGQVCNYPWAELGPFPAQIGLFYDAGAVSPVHAFNGDLARFAFLDYVTSAVAYRLVEPSRVAVLGAGGGSDVLSALYHGADSVTAIEVDPRVVELVRTRLATFAGGLYSRPDVHIAVAEARGCLEASPARHELIQLPLYGAFNAVAAGVFALNESYLYTVEAFGLFLDRLTDNGVLAVNCWLKTPPRDAIKLFATAIDACRLAGIREPAAHLVMVRSWNTATICVARAPLTPAQIGAVRAFCAERGIDLCYCPGIAGAEVNRFTILEEPVYFEAARALLSPDAGRFLDAYPFYIRPATDDRPYFFRSFKWAALPRLIRGMGTEWTPFVEGGYVTLLATIVQSILAGAALILLPLIPLARRAGGKGRKRWIALYFACLGVAYMFLEIAFIQKFMLFLAYPIYAVAVVLTAFLVFSGLGGLAAGRLRTAPAHRVAAAVLGVAVVAAFYLAILPFLFAAAAAWHDAAKVAASVVLLAPLAFCMGVPFPTALQAVSERYQALVPWAWGINGCASVAGATLATFLAVHAGFRAVVVAALLFYLVAAWALHRAAADGGSNAAGIS
ncbi:MAG: SAM-dependent methyltransferase [Candidatus Hydrogenedentes bacterium]|nr:SAM-dependent methyltransferase [Candidatus Hydrogenedentota bacterium]